MAQGAVKKNGKRSQAVSAKKEAILAAALEAFSQFGIHGTRLEQVAERAGVSKTNLLYYYPSKEALYVAVLQQILAIWLAPLKAFREDISPLVAIREYIRLKLEVSRDHPQASKLFCLEMLQGAPLLMGELTGDLKALVDEKSAIVSGRWCSRGLLRDEGGSGRASAATRPGSAGEECRWRGERRSGKRRGRNPHPL